MKGELGGGGGSTDRGMHNICFSLITQYNYCGMIAVAMSSLPPPHSDGLA